VTVTAAADGTYGTEAVRALQAARDGEVEAMRDRPGAVMHARAFSTDDPEAFGWDALRAVMAREGRVTLRGADASQVAMAQEALAEFSPVLHHWDLFMADAETLRRVCTPLAEAPLPDGLTRVPDDAITEDVAREVQAFLDSHGISPFSVDMLLGRLVPASLQVLRDSASRIAATGFASMPHNRHSPFDGIAWVGLIAVDPCLRGLGLGRQIDAICNLVAVEDLGAIGTMEFVTTDNPPSRAMLESCGLRQVEGRSVVMLSTSAERLTR
jgi:hypothetical protein